jgi:hypothetical protein
LTRRFPPSNQESFIDPSTKIKNIKQEVDEDYEKYFNRIIDILKEIGIEDVEPSLQTNIPSRILLNTAIEAFINSIRDEEIQSKVNSSDNFVRNTLRKTFNLILSKQ